MSNLFGNTFDQLGDSLQSVLDGFTASFNDSMTKMTDNFVESFSENFTKMMSGFSEDFSNQLAKSMGQELNELLNSGLIDDLIFQLEFQSNELLLQSSELVQQLLRQHMIISSIPVVLSLVAVIIAGLSFNKIKKVALFDKRLEIHTALQFLFDYKKFANIMDNERLLDRHRLDENMLVFTKTKFVFDELLTQHISDFSKFMYEKITTEEDVVNNASISEEINKFKTNHLPEIEKLIKL